MRIKYNKGFTPEIIMAHFMEITKGMLIGSVNIYIQEYDENMNVIRSDDTYLEVDPGNCSREVYAAYQADQRRRRMKAVV